MGWDEAEFIRKIKERFGTDSVQFFLGFMGESSEMQGRRLYCRPDLTEYVEFNEADALIWEETFHLEGFPLEVTLVWVRRDSEVQHVRLLGRDAQVEFLDGKKVGQVVKLYQEAYGPVTLLAPTLICAQAPPTSRC
jgi:hypothetical protein